MGSAPEEIVTGPAVDFPAARPVSVVAAYGLIAAILVLCAEGGLCSWSPVVVALQGAAVLLSVWARVTFGLRSLHFAADPTPGGLVTTGPYRFIRNPIYAAVGLFVWSGIAVHLRFITVALGVLVAGALVVRTLCEERLLRAHFPEYAAYSRRTSRLIPFIF